jgi:signal transduction histidine kinase
VFERLRWVAIVVPALVIGLIELLSDSLLDPYLPFPWDAVVVSIGVLVLSVVFTTVAYRHIDTLAGALTAGNRALERRIATARALHRVSMAIAALDDLEQILQAVTDQSRDLLSSDVAVLLVVGADGDLAFHTGSGSPDAMDPSGSQPGDDAIRFLAPALASARLAAPLRRGGSTIGLLIIGCRTARSFDVDDVETLSSLANQAAIAIENARLQGRLRELAVVDERERIAREMHDGLAQILGYVNTKSQAVASLLDAGRATEARIQLDELATAARSVYVDVREAILGLRSPVTAESGLVGAVEAYAERFADASKLVVAVEASDEARRLDLAPSVEAQVFRIVQEALTNVRKHAAARRVAVTMAVEDEALVVTLADDGQGFAAAASSAGDWPHYGLQAMRERATAVGGAIDLTASDGAGAVVRLAVPLSRAVAATVPDRAAG